MQPDPHSLTPEALLENLAWVRRLSRSLVSDGNVGDDLAQETWLSALETPPPADRPLRAWLGRVAHNAALQRARRESIRSRHERAAAKPEQAPSDGHLARRIEQQKLVVDCVSRLDQPYRRTVLLRYFEGLSPRSIAARERVPLATVKTRLRRGLQLLRMWLDRSHGGDGRQWILALSPLVRGPGFWIGATLVSTKTAVGIVCAAAVIVAGAFLLARSGEAPEPASGSASGVEVVSPVAPELVAPEQPAAPRDGDLAEASDATQRSALTPASVMLITVEQATGQPVPGADVWFAPQSMLDEHGMREAGMSNGDREEQLRRYGEHTQSDEQAEAQLSGFGKMGVAVARKGELFGLAWMTSEANEPVRLEMDLQRSVTIQVVDEQGSPVAGVPVALGWRQDPGSNVSVSMIWQGETRGDDGMVVMRQFEELVHRRYSTGEVDESEGKWLVVTFPFPLAEPVEVGFDPRQLPAEPVQLVLPETGSLRVDLQDSAGNGHSRAWIYLWQRTGGSSLRDSTDGWGRRISQYVQEGETSLLYPHVGLGLDLKLSADPPFGYRKIELEGLGPLVPGEEVSYVLRFAEKVGMLVGRALGPDGEPLRERTLNAAVWVDEPQRERWELSHSCRTDAEGGFRMPLRFEQDVELREMHLETDDHEDSLMLAGDVTLEGSTSSGGEFDLGDVVLVPPPVVVSGTVQDAAGEPIYWAMVDVAWKDIYGENPDQFVWRNDFDLRAMTHKDGSFTCYGEVTDREYALRVMRQEYVPVELLPFEPGDRGLEIVLRTEGRLEGSVIVPEGISPERIGIEVRTTGDSKPFNWRAAERPHPDGRFNLPRLTPGTFDVFFHLDQESGPVHSVQGVVVEGGGTTDDSRLQNVDLRSILYAFELDVVAEDGESVSGPHIAFRPAGETTVPRRVVFDSGSGTLVTAWPEIDIEVRAHGYRASRLEEVHGDRRIVLQAGIPVRIRLSDDVELPKAPFELRIAVIPRSIYRAGGEPQNIYSESGGEREWRGAWDRMLGGTFGPERELELRLPEPGSYVYELSVQVEVGNRTSSGHAGFGEGPTGIQVLETGDLQEFEVGPHPEALLEALEALRKRLGI